MCHRDVKKDPLVSWDLLTTSRHLYRQEPPWAAFSNGLGQVASDEYIKKVFQNFLLALALASTLFTSESCVVPWPPAHLKVQIPTKDLYFNIVKLTNFFMEFLYLLKKPTVMKTFSSAFLWKLY